MTSLRQWEANRRNALHSTGPKTSAGKEQSRLNAVRHGLTAETVISSLEDAEDYKSFEAAVIADYDARTAVERELVLRLASLLWRLRRATGVETDILRIQAEIVRKHRHASTVHRTSHHTLDAARDRERGSKDVISAEAASTDVEAVRASAARQLTYCFLRLTNSDGGILDRLGRYEASLWRQTAQTIFALQSAKLRRA